MGDSVGTVSNIGLRATEVVTRDEVTIIVPNSELVSAQVINHSKPTPEVRFEGFGESSLDFSVLVWIEDPREDLRISSDLRFAIHAALQAANIEIPYPQRDLHLRSGFEQLVRA